MGLLQLRLARVPDVVGIYGASKDQFPARMAYLQPDAARFFAYLSNGLVEPARALDVADQERAEYTIDLLNLNSPFLVSLRRDWWDELDALFFEHQAKGWSLMDLAAVDLLPQGARLSRFFSLTRQFFGPVGERVLQQRAQELL